MARSAKFKYCTILFQRDIPPNNLTNHEEELLVKWLLHIAEKGFPATKTQLLDSVELLVKKLKRETTFNNGRPEKKWFACFMNRHPILTQRVSQNLTSSRAAVTEEKIRAWFEEIESFIKEENVDRCIWEDPKRIFNADETAFFLSPKGQQVLVRKGMPYDINKYAIHYDKYFKTNKSMKTRTAINERDEDKIKSCVTLIEEYVSQATLTSFKRCSNKEWDGSADNKSLFEFWNYVNSKTGSKQLNNNQEETTKPTMAEDHSNQNQIAHNQEERDPSNQDAIADNQEESVCEENVSNTTRDIAKNLNERSPEKLESDVLADVPTPFKSCLF
ncbi:hypothetical protein MML48_9g00005395 [Holotrichia oblita]|uniref:Uncharacterized protein n=1 Tax=Holotrichia oblita TaxID=644536 RepID=A0ACB9SJU3_HOLOL|nr:hypothetical protein MML48_9g00005395 [Holotrichia oblita]